MTRNDAKRQKVGNSPTSPTSPTSAAQAQAAQAQAAQAQAAQAHTEAQVLARVKEVFGNLFRIERTFQEILSTLRENDILLNEDQIRNILAADSGFVHDETEDKYYCAI